MGSGLLGVVSTSVVRGPDGGEWKWRPAPGDTAQTVRFRYAGAVHDYSESATPSASFSSYIELSTRKEIHMLPPTSHTLVGIFRILQRPSCATDAAVIGYPDVGWASLRLVWLAGKVSILKAGTVVTQFELEIALVAPNIMNQL